MFNKLSKNLLNVTNKLNKKGYFSINDLNNIFNELRNSLIEADVNIDVINTLIEKIAKKCENDKIHISVNPGDKVVHIIKDEITNMLVSDYKVNLEFKKNSFNIVMLTGLNGTGKTTFTAKLGNLFKNKGLKTLLIAGDLYRPQAIEQLSILAQSENIDVFYDKEEKDTIKLIQKGKQYALDNKYNLAIVDTAGRLSLNEELMQEIQSIKTTITPKYTFFVVDATIGQSAVKVAQAFFKHIAFDALLISKIDGDAQGGGVLSIVNKLNRPIKFISTGEKIGDIEQFYPDRIVSRILNMGDLQTLAEKVSTITDDKKYKNISDFTLDDFLKQLEQMHKLGSLQNLLSMIPGMKSLPIQKIDESQIQQIKAIIQSMTPAERYNIDLLNGSRRKRIANGAGVNVSDINNFVEKFKQSKILFKKIEQGGNNGMPDISSLFKNLPK